ncbi:hypothetical protein FRB94_009614 [Tulasnella sp. JGI-2019a]|nr:hypothetical protein FRB94_009614 [Tulasnella sp. JGI-2019a]KAG8996839.1 hypothetical protein FRB93_000651 [Tulasnella sp. JGI-2019a]KAG9035003.1 hypothetical protein FRB95_012293 [Tulasnella sp. JGI-2019a]
MKDQHFDGLVEELQAMEGEDIAVAATENPWLAPIPPKSISTTAASEPQSNADNAQSSGNSPKTRNQLLAEGNVEGGASCVDGRDRLTMETVAQLGDSESLPLHVWKDVFVYPPQRTGQLAL